MYRHDENTEARSQTRALTTLRLSTYSHSHYSDEPNKEMHSLLPTSVSGCVTNFPLFISMWDQPHFAAQHNVMKDDAENSDLFVFRSLVEFINQFFPLALNRLTIGSLLKKVNKEPGICQYQRKARM